MKVDFSDIGDKALEVGAGLVDTLVLQITPDHIIDMVEETVNLVEREDMSGRDKFWYVFDVVMPHVKWFVSKLIYLIIQIKVDEMKAKQ